jgi:cytochrome c oxidase assembly factor CtaG
MQANYILPVVGVVFIIMAFARLKRDQGKLHPQSKTWFLVGGIFIAVGAWLTLTG